jgi:hypothetical protein
MAKNDTNVNQYLDVLIESFKPASSNEYATHFFSTDEIYEAIKDLNPGAEISKDDVYQAMLNAGFSFKPRRGTSGIDFRWLLISKN